MAFESSIFSREWKEALWAKFFTEAPERAMSIEPPEFTRPVARSYRLFRIGASGSKETAVIRVSEPYERDGVWHTDVEIPPIRLRPFVMCGVDAEQALALSDSFVTSLTSVDGWGRDDRKDA